MWFLQTPELDDRVQSLVHVPTPEPEPEPEHTPQSEGLKDTVARLRLLVKQHRATQQWSEDAVSDTAVDLVIMAVDAIADSIEPQISPRTLLRRSWALSRKRGWAAADTAAANAIWWLGTTQDPHDRIWSHVAAFL